METLQPARSAAPRPSGAYVEDAPDPRILDHLAAAVYVCDREGRVTYFNEAAAALWGRRPELRKDMWCGSSRLYELDGEPLPLDCCPMAVTLKEGRAECGHELIVERADGTRRRILPFPEPLRDDNGELIGAISLLVDVTEQREATARLRESELRFANFMGHFPGLAWIKDAQGHYVYANRLTADAFNVPVERLCGRRDDEVLPRATAKLFMHNDRLAATIPGGVQTLEHLPLGDGRERYLLVSKFPMIDETGGPPMIGGIAIDVSDRVRAQDALKESEARKEEFVATLAHELRNPLTPLGIAAQMLHNVRFRDASGSTIVLTLKRQVDNLTRLVDDLLESSRINQGRITLRKADADLKAIVDNAVETARTHLDEARHELRVSLPAQPVRLHVDATRMAQIIGSLLNNAAKFTPDGGRIELNARVESGRLVLSVRDNGMGIPPEQLPYVFDLYAHGGRRHAQGGMGIGLFVAKKLAELHDGTLRAASGGEGQGAELTLVMPCGPLSGSAADPENGARAESGQETSLRILIADDNHGAADIMAIAMRSMGANVRVAYDGKAAVEAVGSFRPAIVFMDIGMGGVDGHEAARQIRADPVNKDLVLIAVSGWGQDEIRQQSLDAGFDHHVVKPIGLEQLRELVHGYTRESH